MIYEYESDDTEPVNVLGIFIGSVVGGECFMAEKSSKDQAVDAASMKSFLKRKRRAVCLGALLSLGIVALGGWLFRTCITPPPAAPVAVKSAVGFVNLQEAIKAHKDYEKLQGLRQELVALREEVKELLPPPRVNPPVVEAKPFDDSIWQKNAQNIIGQYAEIERRKKKAAAEYRTETEDDYIAQRDAIDAAYVNAIANLRMKLDNADVLKLDQEMVAKITAELEYLQMERGDRQKALWEQREQSIDAYAEQAVAQRMEELRAQALAMKESLAAEAMQRQSEAQARNIQRMEQQMDDSMRFRKAMEKRQEQMEKEEEILSLEKHVFNDVAGKASKLAILHHYVMIVANPATNLEALLPLEHRAGPAPERYLPVIASDVEDLTGELMDELKL